jgi:hypothetical protein
MTTPSSGRIVHYISDDGNLACQPIIVAANATEESGVGGWVFGHPGLSPGVYWVEGVPFSEAKAPGSWHWAEQVP